MQMCTADVDCGVVQKCANLVDLEKYCQFSNINSTGDLPQAVEGVLQLLRQPRGALRNLALLRFRQQLLDDLLLLQERLLLLVHALLQLHCRIFRALYGGHVEAVGLRNDLKE